MFIFYDNIVGLPTEVILLHSWSIYQIYWSSKSLRIGRILIATSMFLFIAFESFFIKFLGTVVDINKDIIIITELFNYYNLFIIKK